MATSQKSSDSRRQQTSARPRRDDKASGAGWVGAHPWKGLEATEPTAGWEARRLVATPPPAQTRSHQAPHAHAASVTKGTKPNNPTQAFTA